MLECLADLPSRERLSAFTGLRREYSCDAKILRRRPIRHLAQTTVASNHDSLGVHVPVARKIIYRPAQSPRPCADRAPSVCCGSGSARVQEMLPHAVLAGILEVRLEIAVVDRGQPVTSIDHLLDLPLLCLRAARLLVRKVVLKLYRALRLRPYRSRQDSGVIEHRLVTAKVQPQNHRTRLACVSGQIQQQPHLRAAIGIRREIEINLLPHRAPCKSMPVDLDDVRTEPNTRIIRRASKDIFLEQPDDLRTPSPPPLLRRFHQAAVIQL